MQTTFGPMHYREFVQEVEQAPVSHERDQNIVQFAYISIEGCQSLSKRQTLYASGS
jgi:hypothetical protein